MSADHTFAQPPLTDPERTGLPPHPGPWRVRSEDSSEQDAYAQALLARVLAENEQEPLSPFLEPEDRHHWDNLVNGPGRLIDRLQELHYAVQRSGDALGLGFSRLRGGPSGAADQAPASQQEREQPLPADLAGPAMSPQGLQQAVAKREGTRPQARARRPDGERTNSAGAQRH